MIRHADKNESNHEIAPSSESQVQMENAATAGQQARSWVYLDTFWVLAALSAVMFVLEFFLKKDDPGADGNFAVG